MSNVDRPLNVLVRPGGPSVAELAELDLAVLRSESVAYTKFGSGDWRCFDLSFNPTWGTEVDDPGKVLASAQAMLTWRANHADRLLTDMLLIGGGIGRLPPPAPVGNGGDANR